MKVVYIAGPYRADTASGIVKNIRKAEKVAIEYWRMGYAVICPHKNTSLFDGLADDSVWLEGDIEILRRCDICVMLEGWENSAGAIQEHVQAKLNGLTIYYEQGESA